MEAAKHAPVGCLRTIERSACAGSAAPLGAALTDDPHLYCDGAENLTGSRT